MIDLRLPKIVVRNRFGVRVMFAPVYSGGQACGESREAIWPLDADVESAAG